MLKRLLLPAGLLLCFVGTCFAGPPASRPLVVGYFGQWGLYDTPAYTMKDLANGNKAAMLDQLNYAQAFVTGGHCSVADPNADLNHAFAAADAVNGRADEANAPFRGYFHQLAELKQAYPRLRAVISLEGHAPDFAYDALPENRVAFVASCVDLFMKGNLLPQVSVPGLFDGIDVDWEYPHGADAANFLALLREFRRQMNGVRPGLTLSIAVGPSPRMYDGTDFAAVAAEVDEVGLMTYDAAGPWMQSTGFIAPLYSVPKPAPRGPGAAPAPVPAPAGANPTASTTAAARDAAPAGSVAARPPRGGGAGAVEAYVAAGVPVGKLLLGVPFYGYGWTQVPEADEGVYQEGTPVRGDRPYRFIRSLVATSTVYRDPASGTPWLFDGDAFWTYDDPMSVAAKARFAADKGLGGLMIWELSGDTQAGDLLRAAHEGATYTAVR